MLRLCQQELLDVLKGRLGLLLATCQLDVGQTLHRAAQENRVPGPPRQTAASIATMYSIEVASCMLPSARASGSPQSTVLPAVLLPVLAAPGGRL